VLTELDDPRLIAKRAIMPSGCWEWTAARANNGYGRISWKGHVERVHRVAAHLALGLDLRSAAVVCHRCDNPPCFNPEHLFIGTLSDNTQDMIGKGRGYAGPVPHTHCHRGHPLAGDNLMILGKHQQRRCRTCRNDAQREADHQRNPDMPYRAEPQCGSVARLRRGCKCELCRAAWAKVMRDYRAARKQKIRDLLDAYPEVAR
jgi:hypothetical protein